VSGGTAPQTVRSGIYGGSVASKPEEQYPPESLDTMLDGFQNLSGGFREQSKLFPLPVSMVSI
jgi:hypothetical protein